MSVNPRKRQKQQERRAAKRHAKQQQLAKVKRQTVAERLTAADRYPILHCWVTTSVWTNGLGWVGLSRELPNGSIAFGVFLVDRYCLGVKNALADITSRFTYDSEVVRKLRPGSESEDLDPAAARKLVEGAVHYARSLGFHPHADYHKAKLIFGKIDAGESSEEFEFGETGKPLFIAGPRDGPARCRQILKTLEQHCGPDGFRYVIPFGDVEQVLPESLQREGARLIGPDESGEIRDQSMVFPTNQRP